MFTRIWLGAVAALAACAGPLYEGKYAYDDGWRVAEVTHVATGYALLASSSRDCREELAPENVARRRFARVTFISAREFHSDIVPVAPDSSVQVGGSAYVNMARCDVDAHAR